MTSTLADLTEREWAAQVYELLQMLGWQRYHTYRSKHSRAGYPDETCWRERVLWLELKRETGKLSAEQKRVTHGLLNAGAEVYVVRPSDLEALGKVLAFRGDPFGRPRNDGWVLPLVWAETLRHQTRREAIVPVDPPPV